MERRFIELERSPDAPGVFLVKDVFTHHAPPLNDLIISAPPDRTDEDLKSSVLIHGRWVKGQVYTNGNTTNRGAVAVSREEVAWTGHVFNYGGYAKANRELLSRIRNSIKVQLLQQSDIKDAPVHNDEAMDRMLRTLIKNEVSSSAPHVRFFTPQIETDPRYRICFTMMETLKLHWDFAKNLNLYYDEIWTPTEWNRQLFIDGGVTKPVHVVPLGIDPCVFRPMAKQDPPLCRLMTTQRRNVTERPEGFKFIYLFQPTFRKGVDVLAKAFELAFADDPDASLILATTAYGPLNPGVANVVTQNASKSKIYVLSGEFRDHDLARFYNWADAYVSASRGEGWNLPMCEAAACGKPVIIPRHTAHLDLVDDSEGYVYDVGPGAPYPGAERFCGWYDGMPFPTFPKPSIDQLVSHMREVKANYSKAIVKANKLAEKIRTRYTWDNAAVTVLDRLAKL